MYITDALTKATFGSRLIAFRNRANLSQQALAERLGMYQSDLSKIEKDKQKPPRNEAFLEQLREVLQLSTSEVFELASLGQYKTEVIDKFVFNPEQYPKVNGSEIENVLAGERGFWPVWKLSVDGTIVAANLLAFSLWGALETADAPINPAAMIGRNIFSVYAQAGKRIAMPEDDNSFFYKKIIVFRKLEGDLDPTAVSAFKTFILSNPILQLIYQHASLAIEEEYSYTLKFRPFQKQYKKDNNRVLEYSVLVKQIKEQGQGYLVTFQPIGEYTITYTEQEYKRLISKHHEEQFVQPIQERSYPKYYPTFTLDCLWNILDENATMLHLSNQSGKGMHFFEYYFSDEIRKRVVYKDKETTMRTVQGFLQETKPFQSSSSPLHKQYIAIMQRLQQIDLFRMCMNHVWNELHAAKQWEVPAEGTPVCYPIIQSSHDPSIMLNFASIPHSIDYDKNEYKLTLVPKDAVAKIATILLRLDVEIPYEHYMTNEENNRWQIILQLQWVYALINTIKEGITTNEQAPVWDPYEAYERHRDTFPKLNSIDEDEEWFIDWLNDIHYHIKLLMIEIILQCPKELKQSAYQVLNSFFAQKSTKGMHELLITDEFGSLAPDREKQSITIEDYKAEPNQVIRYLENNAL